MTTCFFDLDGTLTDSRPGLFGAFRAGLRAVRAPELGDAELHAFLGTPLPIVFRAARPDIDAAGIETGIHAFRAWYASDGLAMNCLYPGVPAMLLAVREGGGGAWIVTSKPEPQARAVSTLLGLDPLLDGVIGASLAETDTKTELVHRALHAARAEGRDTLMLGDRHYDVIGARENGVRPVGALWGYGSRAELAEAGCTDFAESTADFVGRFVRAPRALSASERRAAFA